MNSCNVCGTSQLETILELGQQAVSSHFTATANEPVVQRALSLACCHACSTVQLAQPFPFRELVPPFDWITYREPEDHLDGVVAKIRALPGVDSASSVTALSFKDRSTIERLNGHGFRTTTVLDPYRDLRADYPNANIESVAGLLTPALANQLASDGHKADIVIARHVLEHAESCRSFLAALDAMVNPGGYLVIEVPECECNLARRDYAMIWEEHAVYFTQRSLSDAITRAGFAVLAVDVHRYPFEDVMVLYAQKSKLCATNTTTTPPRRDTELASAFGADFPLWTQRYDDILSRLTSDGRKVAAYGAGHLTCAFIHFHNLQRHFSFVVDDTPQKQNLLLPKSGLSIVPRSRLNADDISACLFGLGPQSEKKIIAMNQSFADAGGRFFSMLVDSEISLRKML